jgi:cell wall-associated NlpC family hydrolase
MAKRTLARRLVVAGAIVWATRWVVAQADTKPLPPVEVPEDLPDAAVAAPVAQSSVAFRKRFATSFAFALLFCAGAALSAGAGNELTYTNDGATDTAAVVSTTDAATTTDETTTATDAATTTDVTTTEPAPTTTEAAPAPAPAPAPTTTTEAATPDPPAQEITVTTKPVPSRAPSLSTATSTPAPAVTAPARRSVLAQTRRTAVAAAPIIPYRALEFDPQAWLRNNTASTAGVSAVEIAEHYLGVPYVWGGAEPSTGFDCSGLTEFVYRQLGVYLPHYAAAQFAAFPKLDPTQLEPGDLVFFEPKADGPGHVAIYIGNDEIIEAPHTGALIRIASFSGTAAQLGLLGAVRPYASSVGSGESVAGAGWERAA